MKHFFLTLWEIICSSKINEKLEKLKNLTDEFLQNESFDLDWQSKIEPLNKPSYANFCKIVPGSQVPKRRRLNTKEGRIILVHALVHIEYSAIDLALDHAYRFRYLPREYYVDWLLTAKEEARHFCQLNEILEEFGSFYGELPVHDGLFRAAQRSQDSLAKRMAAVPRYMEARGLDAHPQIMAKLASFKDEWAIRFSQILQVIAEEEIEHVKRGDKWFRYALKKEGLNLSDYRKFVEDAIPGAKIYRSDLNFPARIQAGFSLEELNEYLIT